MEYKLKRILCIDDDEDILSVVQLCLQTVGGYEVFLCTSGVSALNLIQTVSPDLILLDVMMPGMDGPAIIETIRNNSVFKSMPIVFMTARVQPNEVEGYLRWGATEVIAKPFDPMTLSKQIETIWAKHDEGR